MTISQLLIGYAGGTKFTSNGVKWYMKTIFIIFHLVAHPKKSPLWRIVNHSQGQAANWIGSSEIAEDTCIYKLIIMSFTYQLDIGIAKFGQQFVW